VGLLKVIGESHLSFRWRCAYAAIRLWWMTMASPCGSIPWC